ncbi:MAG TPA: hypothetical protein PLL66_03885, partial [Bacteroidales bacterium]|nr:hypothetical protein [Bacteroidales bacterium]
MRNQILGLLVLCPLFVNAQLNRVIHDDIKSQDILFGECDTNGFKLDEFSTWFLEGYNSYEVQESYFNRDFSIQFDSIYVFLGTWCSDSQREIPRFCKIMDHEYFQGTNVRYFALDGMKKSDVIDTDQFYIQFVPT